MLIYEKRKIETLSKIKPWFSIPHIHTLSSFYKYLHHFNVMITKMYSCTTTHMQCILLRSTGPHENFYWGKEEEEKSAEQFFSLFSVEYSFSCCSSYSKETHLPKIQYAMQQMVGPEKIFYSLPLSLFNNAR